MTSRPLWLSLFSGVAHLVIGVPELLRLGPRFLPPSWAAIYAALPDWAWWLWPGLFVVTGVIAIVGGRVPRMAWVGFRLAATCSGTWGTVGFYAWSQGDGGNIPGGTANILAAMFAWVLADYVSLAAAAGHIDKQVAEAVEKIGVEKVEAAANGG